MISGLAFSFNHSNANAYLELLLALVFVDILCLLFTPTIKGDEDLHGYPTSS